MRNLYLQKKNIQNNYSIIIDWFLPHKNSYDTTQRETKTVSVIKHLYEYAHTLHSTLRNCFKFMGNWLSQVFRSVENRASICPVGVVSKYCIGDRNTRNNMSLCSFRAASIEPRARQRTADTNEIAAQPKSRIERIAYSQSGHVMNGYMFRH